MKAWLAVRPATKEPALFLNALGPRHDQSGLRVHPRQARVGGGDQSQPTIGGKRVTPHILRHTCAMHTLQATRDIRKVSLWLGHASLQSTEIYLQGGPNGEARSARYDLGADVQAGPVSGAGQAASNAEHRQPLR